VAFACDIKVIGVIDNCVETRKRCNGQTTNYGPKTEEYSWFSDKFVAKVFRL